MPDRLKYLSSIPIKVDASNPAAHIASISITKESVPFLNLLVTYYPDSGTDGDTVVKVFKATERYGVFSVDPKDDLNGLKLRGNT